MKIMKNLKNIITIAFLSVVLASFSQGNTRMMIIDEIADVASENCDGPKYGTDDQETKKNLSLYGEYYKQKAYADALPYWRYIFFNAPKASLNTYIKGAKMYKALAKEATGELKESYRDTLYAIYEVRLACYGESSKVLKSKAFDWYNCRKTGNEKFVMDLFAKANAAFEKEEKVAPASLLTYWVDVAIRADKTAKAISSDEVMELYEKVSGIIDAQLPGEKGGEYKGSQNKIIEKLDKMGYLNCENIIPMTEEMFRANPDDANTIKKAYKALKSGSCTDSPLFIEVATKMTTVQPSVALYKFLAVKAKKSGDNTGSINYLNKAIELSSDDSEKEGILLQLAGRYYSKGNYSKTREYANKVLEINPNSGKAYITIGRTYASSGKICGTGTDFKSHSVTWVAIDVWNKAKSVDSSVAAEAQKLINKYSQYMPSKNELFMHGIKIGSKYTVACLGRTTTVRSSD